MALIQTDIREIGGTPDIPLFIYKPIISNDLSPIFSGEPRPRRIFIPKYRGIGVIHPRTPISSLFPTTYAGDRHVKKVGGTRTPALSSAPDWAKGGPFNAIGVVHPLTRLAPIGVHVLEGKGTADFVNGFGVGLIPCEGGNGKEGEGEPEAVHWKAV